MTIMLNLAPDMEAYLRERAARKGQNAEVAAQALIAEAMEWEAQDQAETL